MKKYMKFLSAVLLAALLAVTLTACEESSAPSVSETSGTAFENHTIMPKVAEAEEETETEPTAADFDGGFYDDEDYEVRENDEYEYYVYTDHIVLTAYLGEDTIVEIPAEIDGLKVTEIGEWAFNINKDITEVVLPDTVEVIGEYAFAFCDELKSITIPDSVSEIRDDAFSYCKKLEGITIPNSVKEIGESAFSNCENLKSVTLPNDIDKINDWMFAKCSSLTEITIPDSVKEIGEFAFNYCTSLAEITFPENVQIGDYALDETVWIKNQQQPVIISGRLLSWDNAEGDVVIPDGVTRICGGVFLSCKEMTSVTIPDSVKEIGGSAFQNCSLLKSVTIPDGVEIIGPLAFKKCENLTEITIPASVEKIYQEAFVECYKLKNVTLPDSFDNYVLKEAFGDTYWYRKLCDETYVEFRQNEEYGYYVYEDHIVLSKYMEYEEQLDIPSEIDGISVTEIDDGFLSFDGVTSVTIPSSITKIGANAFSFTKLTEVTIPDSVIVLGNGAFFACRDLTDVTLPEHFDDKTIKLAFAYTPWCEENYGEE